MRDDVWRDLVNDHVPEGDRIVILEDSKGTGMADKATTFVGQQLYGAMSVRAGDPRPAPRDEAADELCTFLLYGLAGPALSEVKPVSGG